MHDSITINGFTFNYKKFSDKYIISFIGDELNEKIVKYIDRLFNEIHPYYFMDNILFSNVCGSNVEFICEHIKYKNNKVGKIIIVDWQNMYIRDKYINIIENLFGWVGVSIGASYHALVYIEVNIDNYGLFYIAIETASGDPYKLQFYISKNKNDFDNMLNARYLCKSFFSTFEIHKNWHSFISI